MDYKTHIAGVFDRSAPKYGGFGSHYFEIFAERLVNSTPSFPGASVLDVATGRGPILKRALKQIGNEGKIVGIDLSPQMITETSKEVRAKNASFHCMDAEALDFEDGSFDVVYCGFGLFFFPDPIRALRQFNRVLKPGGKIALSTFGKISSPRKALQESIAAFGINPKVTAIPMPTQDELEKFFSESGFESVKIIADRLDHVHLNFECWIECLWQTSSRSSLEKLTPEQLQALKEQLCRELHSHNRPDGFHEEFNVFYSTAVKH